MNLSGLKHPSLLQVQVDPVVPGNGVSAAVVSTGRTASTCSGYEHDPANLRESAGNAVVGLGFTGKPHVQRSHRTPSKSSC